MQKKLIPRFFLDLNFLVQLRDENLLWLLLSELITIPMLWISLLLVFKAFFIWKPENMTGVFTYN